MTALLQSIDRIEGRLSEFEGVYQTLGKAGIGLNILPVFVAPQEQKRDVSAAGVEMARENPLYCNRITTEVWRLGVILSGMHRRITVMRLGSAPDGFSRMQRLSAMHSAYRRVVMWYGFSTCGGSGCCTELRSASPIKRNWSTSWHAAMKSGLKYSKR